MDSKKCDVCVNIYGKYYQTLLSLKTLLLHDREYINKIFLVFEKKQPQIFDIDRFVQELGYDNIEIFTPKHYFGFKSRLVLHLGRHGLKVIRQKGFTSDYDLGKAKRNAEYRHSIRYQYALEKSTEKYMFIMHNDVVFHKPFLKDMMNEIDNGALGVGSIGQCWNCPLSKAAVCNGAVAQKLDLTYDQVCAYVNQYKSPRTIIKHIDKVNPLPMPECRLNEWVAMINCEEYKKITIPNGKITPFGKLGLDVGTDFYRETVLQGYSFTNIDITPFSTHGFFSQGCGNKALFDNDLYVFQEEAARKYLEGMIQER